MKLPRTLIGSLLLLALLASSGWTGDKSRPSDTLPAPAERFFDTDSGFCFDVEQVTGRSGKVTAMLTLVTREDFAVCSNEIGLVGQVADSTVDIAIQGVYHPVRFYMDTRGPATGAFFFAPPPRPYLLRLTYRDQTDVWRVSVSDTGIVVEPIGAQFTEHRAIWPEDIDSVFSRR